MAERIVKGVDEGAAERVVREVVGSVAACMAIKECC